VGLWKASKPDPRGDRKGRADQTAEGRGASVSCTGLGSALKLPPGAAVWERHSATKARLQAVEGGEELHWSESGPGELIGQTVLGAWQVFFFFFFLNKQTKKTNGYLGEEESRDSMVGSPGLKGAASF
jgi:hypothetical protein